jgi:hypothetical protein
MMKTLYILEALFVAGVIMISLLIEQPYAGIAIVLLGTLFILYIGQRGKKEQKEVGNVTCKGGERDKRNEEKEEGKGRKGEWKRLP